MLPIRRERIRTPPIKCQGIKTKLVPFILSGVSWKGTGRWVEPFLGSGVVLFNAHPDRALVADTNPHIIALYQAIQKGLINAGTVERFLTSEGKALRDRGEQHYYEIRARFNEEHRPLDFLFLNRSCFNGMIRFNRKGGFNVPFCRKPERFRQAYVTKICNQVSWVAGQMRGRDWVFRVADWRDLLRDVVDEDLVYLDPPYVGRHTDYFNQWTEQEADELASVVKGLPCGWAYSMWLENQYRRNGHVDEHFSSNVVLTREHFYHLGATEELRHAMQEALVVSDEHVNPDFELLLQPDAEQTALTI